MILEFMWAIARVKRYKNGEEYDEIDNRVKQSGLLNFVKILIVVAVLSLFVVSLVYYRLDFNLVFSFAQNDGSMLIYHY